MAETEKRMQRRVPLWVKLLLGLSLALNLAVLGLLGGIATRLQDRGPGAVNYAIPYVIALPKDERRSIGKQIRQKARAGELPSRKDRMSHYRQMLTLLEAESWNAREAEAILVGQSTDTVALQSAARAAWLETMAGFSPEERLAYAERLRKVVNRGPRNKRRDR